MFYACTKQNPDRRTDSSNDRRMANTSPCQDEGQMIHRFAGVVWKQTTHTCYWRSLGTILHPKGWTLGDSPVQSALGASTEIWQLVLRLFEGFHQICQIKLGLCLHAWRLQWKGTRQRKEVKKVRGKSTKVRGDEGTRQWYEVTMIRGKGTKERGKGTKERGKNS